MATLDDYNAVVSELKAQVQQLIDRLDAIAAPAVEPTVEPTDEPTPDGPGVEV
jgi:hypothetical protein